MANEKKKYNIGTYAVVLILAAIFIIIIAAMADNREDHFENQITKQNEINQGIQERIVTLESDNYNLKKSNDELTSKNTALDTSLTFYKTIDQVYALALEGKPAEASAKLREIDPSALGSEEKAVYDTLQKQLQLPLEDATEEETPAAE